MNTDAVCSSHVMKIYIYARVFVNESKLEAGVGKYIINSQSQIFHVKVLQLNSTYIPRMYYNIEIKYKLYKT